MTMSAHHKDPSREARIVECKRKYPNLTVTDLSERFGMSRPYVSQALRKAGIRTYKKAKV